MNDWRGLETFTFYSEIGWLASVFVRNTRELLVKQPRHACDYLRNEIADLRSAIRDPCQGHLKVT